MFISLFNINAFGDNVFGQWYRNSIFSESELIINENMVFTIEATNNANLGTLEGELIKIRDGYYFSYINDKYDSGQSCLIILIDRINNIELIVYGDQVGAGAGVYFDGLYEKHKMNHDEYIEKSLDYIFGKNFDRNIIKELLGMDIEYFVKCFGSVSVKNIEHSIFIEGFMRGAAPWQNGIIKIENVYIYILITDCRAEPLFRYYTNNITHDDLPDEFRNWYYYNEEMNIEKGIMD